MHFIPSVLSSLASLENPGLTKSPLAQRKKSLALTYILLDLMVWNDILDNIPVGKVPNPCADPESFARGVPTLTTFF